MNPDAQGLHLVGAGEAGIDVPKRLKRADR
jgi:hypothetical protein